MAQCTKCGVIGGCNCLFTKTPSGLICGLCTGKANMEKAAEIKYLREQQGIVVHENTTKRVVAQILPKVSDNVAKPFIIVNRKRKRVL